MYHSCLFCHESLGQNEALEHLPIGRSVAYDSWRGRLWVVCNICDRWNLSPLETRWEAMEEAERAFSSAQLIISSENIALARLSEGLELIRIGRPNRPEFAAWRYGNRFATRRRNYARRVGPLLGLASAATLGAVTVWGPVVLFLPAVGAGVWHNHRRMRDRTRITAVRMADGRWLHVRRHDLPDARLVPSYVRRSWDLRLIADGELHELDGPRALAAAEMILPAMNGAGARMTKVEDAVRFLEEHGSPDQVFYGAAKLRGHSRPLAIESLPRPVRLALEMAANEEAERELAEIDLARLEDAWREAEEIAAVADQLATPVGIEPALRRLKERVLPMR
jgi:hypothetical protein